MSFDALFGTPVIQNPFVESGRLVEGGKLVYFPTTTRVHAGLTRAMIEREKSLVVVTPSDRSVFVHLLALEALFTNTDRSRNAVFVLSSNTEFRERFRELAPRSIVPPHDNAPYSREETPIANVTASGSLATVTKNLNYPDKPPRFLFSYTSTRIPSDEVGQRVRCIVYDDSVKYHPDRLERLRRWRVRNDVPAAIYLTSNPTGGVVEDMKDDVFVWSWPPRLLSEAVATDVDSRASWPTDKGATSQSTRRAHLVSRREQIRADGVSFDVHVCGGEEVNEMLSRANDARAKFVHLARKMDSEVLYEAKPLIQYALRDFQELLTPLDFATFHARRTSIPARIAGLDRFQRRIGSDPGASPAGGSFRDALSAFEELASSWDDVAPKDKKEGELVSLLYAVLDRGESVSVVASSESQSRALTAYLQTEHPQLYRDLGGDLSVHDGHGVRSAPPTDNVILYGSLRWGQRDLLRTDVASEAVVLAYPVELGLLYTQVRAVDDAFSDIADRPFWSLVDRLTQKACATEADVEHVDIDVPYSEETSKSGLGEDLSIEEGDEADLGDLVRTFEPGYESSRWEVDPSTFSADGSGPSRPSARGETTGRVEPGCVDVHFVDGHATYLRPDDTVHVVRAGHDKLFKKSVRALKPGDLVVHLEDTDAMRETLYSLIRERGDVGLYYYANLWRVSLEAALEETGDDVSDFADRMEAQGLTKSFGTYERWYNFEVHRTRSKKSLWAIADAYDLDVVKEHFSEVWDAVFDMEAIYGRLKRALRDWALQSVASGTQDDVMLSESPDIRLSDFDIDRYLYKLEVSAVQEDVTAQTAKIGRLREV